MKYSSGGFHPHLVLMTLLDSILLNLIQFKTSLECVELEGCFSPKEFDAWEQYAQETRKLMSKEFGLELLPGNFKDKLQMEKEVSPLNFQY